MHAEGRKEIELRRGTVSWRFVSTRELVASRTRGLVGSREEEGWTDGCAAADEEEYPCSSIAVDLMASKVQEERKKSKSKREEEEAEEGETRL